MLKIKKFLGKLLVSEYLPFNIAVLGGGVFVSGVLVANTFAPQFGQVVYNLGAILILCGIALNFARMLLNEVFWIRVAILTLFIGFLLYTIKK